jgi:hypothetical protein
MGFPSTSLFINKNVKAVIIDHCVNYIVVNCTLFNIEECFGGISMSSEKFGVPIPLR